MSARLAVPVFLLWTLVVRVGRIRNIVADDDLSASAKGWRLGLSILFVVLVIAVFAARRARSGRATALLGALVALTVGWWTFQGLDILLDPDHDIGFKIVHTILMIVSIGLAMWAWARRDG